MTSSILQTKSFRFSIKISSFCRKIVSENKDYNLSNQLFRSGTSIGGQSKKDFLSKIYIAHKEARGTSYWLKLTREIYPEYSVISNELINLCEELLKMSGKTIITIKSSIQ